MDFDLTLKQALDGPVQDGVEPFYMAYDPTKPGTDTLESDAVAAGFVQHARQASDTLVEVIFLLDKKIGNLILDGSFQLDGGQQLDGIK